MPGARQCTQRHVASTESCQLNLAPSFAYTEMRGYAAWIDVHPHGAWLTHPARLMVASRAASKPSCAKLCTGLGGSNPATRTPICRRAALTCITNLSKYAAAMRHLHACLEPGTASSRTFMSNPFPNHPPTLPDGAWHWLFLACSDT